MGHDPSLQCFKDDGERDEKQSDGDQEGEGEGEGVEELWLLEERIQRSKDDNEDPDVAESLAYKPLRMAFVDVRHARNVRAKRR